MKYTHLNVFFFVVFFLNFLSYLIHCQRRHSDKIVLSPSENGSTLLGKNLLPQGANSFLIE